MTLEAYVQGFGCLPNPTSYRAAARVVVPVPLEICPSEAPGASLGPLAILGASRFIETYDAELGLDPLGTVATLDTVALDGPTEDSLLAQIEESVGEILTDDKTPLCLGGERIIALPAARAARGRHGEVGVVMVSRRPGFLKPTTSRRHSVETIGRHLTEDFPVVFIGQRTWSAAEAEYIRRRDALPLFAAHSIRRGHTLPEHLIDALPQRVHLSIDVGVLDPATLPAPGNTEPGGLGWYDLTAIVAEVFNRRRVVSCDVSGFAPQIGQVASGLVVAQLVLRCLALMAGN